MTCWGGLLKKGTTISKGTSDLYKKEISEAQEESQFFLSISSYLKV